MNPGDLGASFTGVMEQLKTGCLMSFYAETAFIGKIHCGQSLVKNPLF